MLFVYYNKINLLFEVEKCHRFTNPCGCNLRAPENTGAGAGFVGRRQPVPVGRVGGIALPDPAINTVLHRENGSTVNEGAA